MLSGNLKRAVLWVLFTLPLLGATAAAVPDPSAGAGYQVVRRSYSLPDLVLVDAEAKPVRLRELLDGEQPVIMNFVYASCTTICPILSATFAKAYRLFKDAGEPVQFVSVSIDPEQDTPEQLKKYAEKFKAGPGWHFLTGDVASVQLLQQTFDTFRGSKANHPSVVLIHARRDGPWSRLEGAIPAAAVLKEFQLLK
jgi:protein SCO1/2